MNASRSPRPADTRWSERGIASAAAAALVLVASVLPHGLALAQTEPDPRPPQALKRLSLEELLNLEVTSVSKSPERLSQAASAIQVITSEEIRRSGAMTLPEVLRLATNLQVARVNAHDWAITSRGFSGAPISNGSLANKLLVLIDGRSVYTPLFGGVFWDIQHVLAADIERIEVISGPGGTLWGANAVNGVINVVTKSASETRGVYASVAAGSSLRDFGAVRVGGPLGSGGAFRAFVRRIDRTSTETGSGTDAHDEWGLTVGGFRADFAGPMQTWTIQGDVYGGREGDPVTGVVDGENLLGRWTRTFSARSELRVQAYFDRAWREITGSGFREDLRTYDLDVQHGFPIGGRNSLLWGAGARLAQDDVGRSRSSAFVPARRDMRLWSAFVQDEIELVPDRLRFTVGSKLEHNDFTGIEVQPSARLAWAPTGRQTVWTAVSRAVRSPSRFDVDLVSPGLAGSPDFVSEELTAYELGYRVQPTGNALLSLAGFRNRYENVRSISTNSTPPPALVFANGLRAETWGVEASATLQPAAHWRIRFGYTHLHERFEETDPAVFPGSEALEAIDPRNHCQLISSLDLPGAVQLDIIGRYVEQLDATVFTARVPAYGTFDVRLAREWPLVELSLVGQNLGDERHAEFGTQALRSSFYARATVRR